MIDFNKTLSPKNDLQGEMRVLSTLIGLGVHNHPICYEIFTMIDESYFYNHDTKELFRFLFEQYQRRHPFDFSSIFNKVPAELTKILDAVVGDGYFSKSIYQQDVRNLHMLKNLRPQIAELQSILHDCVHDNVPTTCSERLADGIGVIANLCTDTKDDYCETYEQLIEEILTSDDVQTELATKLETWPALPFPGMISIAGRPSVGKTFMGIFLMEHIIQVSPGKQALYFNLEMDKKTMIQRHAGIIAESFSSLRHTIQNAAPELLKRDVKLISRSALTIEEIELVVRAQSMKKPLSVIVVDYIGLVQAKKKYDRDDLKHSDIAQRLAALSLEHHCIVLALLQVNREHKNRAVGDKCPEATDAAESLGSVKSSEWWVGLDQPQLDSEADCYKDLFIIKNRKSRGKAGYFTVYMEFKNGTFTEINQHSAKLRLEIFGESPKVNKIQTYPIK